MNKEKVNQLLEEANEAAAAISGCCDGIDGCGFDEDGEYVNTIEKNAHRLLEIAKELASEASVCKSC